MDTATAVFYEPFLGGGILTALSIPIVVAVGSLRFGLASLLLTVLFAVWGVIRCRRQTAATAAEPRPRR